MRRPLGVLIASVLLLSAMATPAYAKPGAITSFSYGVTNNAYPTCTYSVTAHFGKVSGSDWQIVFWLVQGDLVSNGSVAGGNLRALNKGASSYVETITYSDWSTTETYFFAVEIRNPSRDGLTYKVMAYETMTPAQVSPTTCYP